MRETRTIMGMPITLAVLDESVRAQDMETVFAAFAAVDAQFSPFKNDSEVSRFNRGEVSAKDFTPRMREVIALCERTRWETSGYFDINRPDGTVDPCGMVKGWAIRNAARQLAVMGFSNFCVEAGGDIQCQGVNACKGKSACHGANNACAGQNSCKGKGWIQTTEKECKAKGGKVGK